MLSQTQTTHLSKLLSYILRHKPEVIDLLFKCASLRREPWYPENQCDSVACEVIALLFMDLLERVPGVHTVLPDAAQAADDAEAEAFNESLQILFSRNNWVENIFGVYKRLDDEKWQESLQSVAPTVSGQQVTPFDISQVLQASNA